jgi:hypothetical protein
MNFIKVLVLALIIGFTNGENMNGLYQVASGERQNVKFNSDFGSRGFEYFDVYSKPISTRYAEVYWKDQQITPLPKKIVERFANRTLVITGYEIDQVFAKSRDVSIPITWVYNHHCGILLHGEQYYDIPAVQEFSEGNGGEYRKSFHGYDDGIGQLLHSPTSFTPMAMFIDTRNRDCGVLPSDLGKCANENMFGVEPKQARYGRVLDNMNVSGLMHCPCTSSYGGDSIFYGKDTPTKSKYSVEFSKYSICQNGFKLNYDECVNTKQILGLKSDIIVIDDNTKPQDCILDRDDNGNLQMLFNNNTQSFTSCILDESQYVSSGSVASNFNVSVDIMFGGEYVDITVKGENRGWFAVGFGGQKMNMKPWTIVIYPESKYIFEERRIGDCDTEGGHCSGVVLNSTLNIITKEVIDGMFTVKLRGNVSEIPYRFVAMNDVVMARGENNEISYHQNREASKLLVIPDDMMDSAMCICKNSVGGMCNVDGSYCDHFVKPCLDNMLKIKNPTCNSQTYSGGLECCSHKTILLDDEQIIPKDDVKMKYQIKWRFYFDDRNNYEYKNAIRVYAQTEAHAGEYDVPPAKVEKGNPLVVGYPELREGDITPGTECFDGYCHHVLTRQFTINLYGKMKLVMASGHCHAPRCKRMELWMNRTDGDRLLCVQIPIYGGGSGEKYDEAGYIRIPPCLFGKPPLEKPPILEYTTQLYSVKYTENTYNGNYGEMASWQMRSIYVY